MPFVRENVPSNVDREESVERGILLPFPSDPAVTWVYYECMVECVLDNGIVVHNCLPQVDRTADTLASSVLGDSNLNKVTDGVNLRSNDQYQDIVQRMGHSRYWFRLWGRAMRIGYQIPIPSLKTIGGVLAIPYDKNPQWAHCSPVPGGNYGGAILWRAEWSLWYTTAAPPTTQSIPVTDATTGLTNVPSVSKGIQAPISQPDDNVQKSSVRQPTQPNQPNVISQ